TRRRHRQSRLLQEIGAAVPDADAFEFHGIVNFTDCPVIRFWTLLFEPFLNHFEVPLCELAVVELYAEHFQRVIKFRGELKCKECGIESDAFEYDDPEPHLKRNQTDAEYRDELQHQRGLERILQNVHRIFDIAFIECLETVRHGLARLRIPHRVLPADQVEEYSGERIEL